MRYRLLALDIDGTLLRPDGTLSPRVRDALGRAVAAGVSLLLCTGRRYRSALEVLGGFTLSDLVACSSGAVIKRLGSWETVFSVPIERRLAARVVEVVRGGGLRCLVIVDGPAEGPDFWYEVGSSENETYAAYMSRNAERYGHGVGDLARELPPVPLQVCVPGQFDELAQLERVVTERFGSGVHTSLVTNIRYPGCMLEIGDPGGCKHHAVEWVASSLGVDMSSVVAVGDDNNDVTMLRGAGLGVAMGNAVPALLALADEVVASNENDGVAEVVDRFILGPA